MSFVVRYTVEAEEDLLKLAEFEYKATGDTRAVNHLRTMLDKLGDTPQIGKIYDETNKIRQIHIPFGKSGYSALYTVHDVIEVVGMLRIKYQRENRYSGS